MAKQTKKIKDAKADPQTVQLNEVEMLRIHNAFLRWQQAATAAQQLSEALDAARDAVSKRVGVDIKKYDFTNDGVGHLRKQTHAVLPDLPIEASKAE